MSLLLNYNQNKCPRDVVLETPFKDPLDCIPHQQFHFKRTEYQGMPFGNGAVTNIQKCFLATFKGMRGRLNDWWCKDRLKEKGQEGGLGTALLPSLDRYGETADPDNCGGMLSTRYQPPKVEKTRAGSRAIQ
ncbi:jg11819 [Pararge aegeria aegeria]|uniref:Jg11819 protein n=1 Tax=Pararge aegeria aegeria TaxID=348720 RepID=A0A8S4S436_9NEOP|nr:jg11819 [Pararge aegeria aegeria]